MDKEDGRQNTLWSSGRQRDRERWVEAKIDR